MRARADPARTPDNDVDDLPTYRIKIGIRVIRVFRGPSVLRFTLGCRALGKLRQRAIEDVEAVAQLFLGDD